MFMKLHAIMLQPNIIVQIFRTFDTSFEKFEAMNKTVVENKITSSLRSELSLHVNDFISNQMESQWNAREGLEVKLGKSLPCSDFFHFRFFRKNINKMNSVFVDDRKSLIPQVKQICLFEFFATHQSC